MSDLKVLIVDDEPLAAERLQILLARIGGTTLTGTAHDGEQALRMVEALEPDLMLLDISMPGMDGIDVARALSERALSGQAKAPLIVFVTAYDNFAVAAFDVAAIDYLMKPVVPERLEKALERAREHPRNGAAPGRPASPYVEEYWVPEHHGLVRIGAREIERITAERDYMRLHVGARSWLIHRTIAKMEAELDPEVFIRVHRSVILRRDTIRGLRRDDDGRWNARLPDGAEQRIGRSYADAVRALTGRAAA